MLFAIHCLDKPDHAALRQANREAHLAYARSFGDKILFGGPLLTADGSGMIGSLLVMEAADRAEVEAYCTNDPYQKAGLFESVVVRPYKMVLGSKVDPTA